MRVVNWLGGALERLGIGRVHLSPESLKRAAQRQVKLSDFGDGDFEVGLAKLTESISREARLNYLGKRLTGMILRRRLGTRLRVCDTLRRFPEVLENKLRQPMFIVGHPRTGTTLLHNVLALEPCARAPQLWELLDPAPPASLSSRSDLERKTRTAQMAVSLVKRFGPQMEAIHAFWSPNAVEEDFFLLEPSFFTSGWLIRCYVPTYLDWLAYQPVEASISAYRFFSDVLKMLMHGHDGKRWVGKTPFHAMFLPALASTFPDALIVHTHRDPVRAVPSTCSLWEAAYSLGSDKVDRREIANIVLRYRELADTGIAAGRAAQGGGRTVDVDYDALVRDPIDTVGQLYDKLGFQLTADYETTMRDWLANQDPWAPKRRGRHVYRAEDYGLSVQQLQRLSP